MIEKQFDLAWLYDKCGSISSFKSSYIIFRTLVDWWDIMPKADIEKHAIEVRVEPQLLKMRPVGLHQMSQEKAS